MIFNKILLLQTAFIGDVILATSLIEKLHQYFPEAQIDFMLRKGNESLLNQHPKINKLFIWDKKGGKYKNILQLIPKVRAEKYDLLINLQRFATAGIFGILSGATYKVCFDKNPLSFFFDKAVPHQIGTNSEQHETERNQLLIQSFTDSKTSRPKLYPTTEDYNKVADYQKESYLCLAPTSVWFTKQFPKEKWIELLKKLPSKYVIYLLGAPADITACEHIRKESNNKNVVNLSGKLSLLQSAALMQKSSMNFVNDSAPMHLSSAMNAPTCAIFCSTIKGFGFTPLSDISKVVEVKELDCRPCGLHGHKRCPKGHFDCGYKIDTNEIVSIIEN